MGRKLKGLDSSDEVLQKVGKKREGKNKIVVWLF